MAPRCHSATGTHDPRVGQSRSRLRVPPTVRAVDHLSRSHWPWRSRRTSSEGPGPQKTGPSASGNSDTRLPPGARSTRRVRGTWNASSKRAADRLGPCDDVPARCAAPAASRACGPLVSGPATARSGMRRLHRGALLSSKHGDDRSSAGVHAFARVHRRIRERREMSTTRSHHAAAIDERDEQEQESKQQ